MKAQGQGSSCLLKDSISVDDASRTLENMSNVCNRVLVLYRDTGENVAPLRLEIASPASLSSLRPMRCRLSSRTMVNEGVSVMF